MERTKTGNVVEERKTPRETKGRTGKGKGKDQPGIKNLEEIEKNEEKLKERVVG